jgi:hypothetical protein
MPAFQYKKVNRLATPIMPQSSDMVNGIKNSKTGRKHALLINYNTENIMSKKFPPGACGDLPTAGDTLSGSIRKKGSPG